MKHQNSKREELYPGRGLQDKQTTKKKRLLQEAPALHVATTKMGGAYSLLTLFKMVKNFNGLTVCLNIMVFSYEMYAHRKFFSYEISVI